jgi:predicted nuclease with RNAse H fold
MDRLPVLAVGWDVGGWCGDKQAVAVAEWKDGRPSFVHPGTARFRIDALDETNGLLSMLRLAWENPPAIIFDHYRVVLAIDAPLGFPLAFRDLVTGEVPETLPEAKEIDNRFAYRECDRHIYKQFGKKPLSASFDRLGNNATVAIFWARRWAWQYSMAMLPFRKAEPGQHCIIEVYPALAKMPQKPEVFEVYKRHVPASLELGDERDAAICALMALAFESRYPRCLPPLEEPDRPLFEGEGWIYHPPPSSGKDR